jgi:protein arginine kinase activator
VFHITELEGGGVREIHLCEDHARAYLNQAESGGGGEGGKSGAMVGPLAVGQTAEELAELDQRACDMCGITFLEFRNQGRLGCPHDYVQFERELEPLIANIHGATAHTGRRPSRLPATAGAEASPGEAVLPEAVLPEDTGELTEVIGRRRALKEAIAAERYEDAREHRDAIRATEERWLAPRRRAQPGEA